ncbi:MAG: hypothetical protein OXI80_14245 [Caldilineaceae bacterium]|nr:hypothetical protein [Caldilineaceae bacterium]MDE0338827.1 hypothetical protein [Caldilineaceae bacterium]
MDEWFFLNVFEPYLEPFCYFGIPALAAIGLVAFVAIVLRDWKRARRRTK